MDFFPPSYGEPIDDKPSWINFKNKKFQAKITTTYPFRGIIPKKTKNPNMFMHIKRNNLLLHRPKHKWIGNKHINHPQKKKGIFNGILITQKKKLTF